MIPVKQAVVTRISQLCEARRMSLYQLAIAAGMTPSTVYSLALPNRHDVGIVTIEKICAGLDISVAEFFNSDLFGTTQQ